jgi:hypothetical protein
MLDLFPLEGLLILIEALLGHLRSLESILYQGSHTLVLFTLSFQKLFLCIFLLLVTKGLELSFHFFISKRFLALLHASYIL